MRMRLAGTLAPVIALAVLAAPNEAVAACGFADVPTVSKKMANANGTIDAVDQGKVDRYTLKLSKGEHYLTVWSPGDIDLIVCKRVRHSWRQVCYSHNSAAVPDGCLAEDSEDALVVQGVGPFLVGPGKFRILLRQCTNTACGYPALPDPAPHDAPVPLPYLLSLV
jgi:hypothetical protein